jgi:uncharacterized membrane protein
MSRAAAIHPKSTSRLVVIAFGNMTDAFKMKSVMQKLEETSVVHMEDIVVVTRRKNGQVKLHQEDSLPAMGGACGSFLGLLLGVLFAVPVGGFLLGTGMGALAGRLGDAGVTDKFMRELGSTLVPGSSALFLLVQRSSPEKVLEALQDFSGKCRVLQTTLSPDREKSLRKFMENPASYQ